MLLWKCEASSKNNEKNIVVQWQQLRASVLFFICLVGCLWLLLWKSGCQILESKFKVWNYSKWCYGPAWHPLFRKGNYWGFCGKWKNDTLAGPFDFVGADHYFIGILNLAINVVSDGLHSQKQCIIIPSGAWQERRQGYCFFMRIEELKIVFV